MCKNKTASALMLCVIGLTACEPTISAIETERAIYDAWESTLFLPSRQDTLETARKVNDGIAVFEAASGREFVQ